MSAEPVASQPDIHTSAGKLADLQHRYEEAVHAGSARAVERQHAKGKKDARERIELLLDEGSFVELDELARHRSTNFGMDGERPYGDGVVTGYGTVDGRPVCVFAQDFTVFGGSLGEVFGEKIVKVMDLAMKTGCPVVGINDSGGARIQEGVVSLGLYGEIFYRNVMASGRGAADQPGHGTVRGRGGLLPRDHRLHRDGRPELAHVHHRAGRDQDGDRRGRRVRGPRRGQGAQHQVRSRALHGHRRGRRDRLRQGAAVVPAVQQPGRAAVADTEADLSVTDLDRELDTFVPDSANQPYDMHTVIEHVVDDGEFLEVQPLFAPNILVGFGRVEGRPVGVVANQPMQFAGTLDIDASEKAARFVRTCDCFNVPVLTFVDVPGFLPGTSQEWGGIIRRGAKLIYAYAEATVPKVTVITRKAYGGAYDVMGSKHLRADVNVAWPTAQIAVMGAQGAVNILYRREIGAAADPEATRAEKVQEYEDTLANPYVAAERGYLDSVIPPSHTRRYVTQAVADAPHQARPSPRKSTATSPSRWCPRSIPTSGVP
jgi:propionyl-CoA carboxylase beta chain